MPHHLILGTRSSPMAIAVAEHARALLQAAHPNLTIDVRGFLSDGDKNLGDLSSIGGKGAFVKDLERRLLAHEIDCVIHALKDFPGDIPMHPDLQLACFITREDPRDALVMLPGTALPESGAPLILATSSPRRQALLRQMYPQVNIITLRGNVNSRFDKLQRGAFDGMVLSVAGLGYLGLRDRAVKIYEPDEMLPSVGQGVLCLQVRREDMARCSFLRSINHTLTETTVRAERAMLAVLQGNCHSAIAGYCVPDGDHLSMRALVSSPDGTTIVRAALQQSMAEVPEFLGRDVGAALLAQGASALIAA